MNTTDAATVDSRPVSTLRALARRALAPLAVTGALVASVAGVATPAHAAGYINEGTYSLNTYYGSASGWGYITSDARRFQIAGYTRDVRSDSFCAVSQARALLNGAPVTGWYKGASTCSTTVSAYGQTPLVTTSSQVNQIQVRTCQADRNGNAVGTCSSPVYVMNWRLVTA